jgi:hypothetical protein
MWGPFLGGGVALCEIPDSNPAIEKSGYSTKGWRGSAPMRCTLGSAVSPEFSLQDDSPKEILGPDEG